MTLALNSTTTAGYEALLSTAAGKITCRRCQARSGRTKLQCGRPAISTSKKSKCQFHGGRSTGPRTQEGLDRIRAAHWKHGESTKVVREKQSAKNLMFCYLEDLVNHLHLISAGNKKAGKRPKGYVAHNLNTEEGLAMAIRASLNTDDS